MTWQGGFELNFEFRAALLGAALPTNLALQLLSNAPRVPKFASHASVNPTGLILGREHQITSY
jgi:hypothetical protein